MFNPSKNKIHIELIKSESIFGDEKNYMGKILAVGKNVKDYKVGETIIFLPHGYDETPEIDGKKIGVVEQDLILGTYGKKSKIKSS